MTIPNAILCSRAMIRLINNTICISSHKSHERERTNILYTSLYKAIENRYDIIHRPSGS